MKAIIINKCFEECPHCLGPTLNKKSNTFHSHCGEDGRLMAHGEDDTIPEWCPLDDDTTIQSQAKRIEELEKWSEELLVTLGRRTQTNMELESQVSELVEALEEATEDGDLGSYDSSWYEKVSEMLNKIKEAKNG